MGAVGVAIDLAMRLGRPGVDGLHEVDLDGEVGRELAVVPAQEVVVADHALLVADDLNVGLPGLALEHDLHRVTIDGEDVALPLKEFELLHLLLANAGRVLPRETLIDRVWGSDYVGDTKTLDVHIKRLRAKVEPDPASPTRIITYRGLGYKFDRSRES